MRPNQYLNYTSNDGYQVHAFETGTDAS